MALTRWLWVGLMACLMAAPAWAQSATKKSYAGREANRERINQNTIAIVTGNPNGTYLAFGYDLAAVLDKGDELRILAIVGKGATQNVHDALFLRGVDMGITQTDVMGHFRRTAELGHDVGERLVYISKLYNEEMHVVTGPGINNLKELEGKPFNFSDVGSGTQFSARLVFQALGIKVNEVNMGQADALVKIKSGEIAGTVLFGGKPAGAFAKLPADGSLKLLPVPYLPAMETDYFPARFTSQDYPGLVAEGKSVETIAVGAVLAAYNWTPATDRHRRLVKFTDAFFSKFAEFQKPPRHIKWKEVNIDSTLPGWKRFPYAQQWLDANRPKRVAPPAGGTPAPAAAAAATAAAAAAPASSFDKQAFDRFLAEQKATGAVLPRDEAGMRALFNQYLEWSKRQRGQGEASGGKPPTAQPAGTRLW